MVPDLTCHKSNPIPQNESRVKRFVFFAFGVINFWVYPCSLVVWVVNLFWFPFSLVFWFVPVFWFGVFWVVHLCIIYPVFWFLCFGILDLLCWKHIPVFF